MDQYRSAVCAVNMKLLQAAGSQLETSGPALSESNKLPHPAPLRLTNEQPYLIDAMCEDDTVALQRVSLYQTVSWVVAGTSYPSDMVLIFAFKLSTRGK